MIEQYFAVANDFAVSFSSLWALATLACDERVFGDRRLDVQAAKVG